MNLVRRSGQGLVTRDPSQDLGGPDDGAQVSLRVDDVVAAYGNRRVVHGVTFEVHKGEQLSLLGPSGCGKSTVLRCIAGLETPTSGEIRAAGRVLYSSSKGVNLSPDKRKLSMVFQSYAIWPHMTVANNVKYALTSRGVTGEPARARVREVLRQVGMEEYIDQPATNLSGGQQQRVALARSYAYVPDVLLLDEPLSNLDARLRVNMREELKEIQRSFGATTVYVTHDLEEAMAISDRIIVMRDGVIEQEGTPLDIYNNPQTEFVADFIGAANIFSGEWQRDADGATVFRTGDAAIVASSRNRPQSGSGKVAIRTVYPNLSPAGSHRQSTNDWPGRVERTTLLGDTVKYQVSWPGGLLTVLTTPKEIHDEGTQVTIHIPAEHVVPLIDKEGK